MKLPNQMIYRYQTLSGQPGMLADMHCHNQFELIYVTSGDMLHVIEGRRYRLKTGDLALIRPSTYHYLQRLSDAPYTRHNIQFDPETHGIDISLLPQGMEVISLLNNPIASGLFQKMEYYRNGLDEETFGTILQQLLQELFINLRLFSDNQAQQETLLSPILSRALDYINEHLFTITNVEEVAQELFVSSSYLFYLFRTTLHQTPKKYISDKRLLAAQRRLFAGGRPSLIYKECGFHDYTSFYRSYKAFFGHSPSCDSKVEDISSL